MKQKIKSEREFCYTQILVFGYTFIEPYIISNASLIVVGSRKGQLSSACGLWVNNSWWHSVNGLHENTIGLVNSNISWCWGTHKLTKKNLNSLLCIELETWRYGQINVLWMITTVLFKNTISVGKLWYVGIYWYLLWVHEWCIKIVIYLFKYITINNVHI